ncbi:MAG: amidohydrolase [Desulfobacteraceae bacterium]|nr:amidohydrolase [Desulfobacteraceae bacterium]
MPDLTVSLIQSDLAWEDIEANLAMFDAKLDTIEAAVDLILLPEMFSTGFSMNAARLAEPMNGKAVAWLQAQAVQKKTHIAGSLMIQDNGRFYNRLIWARPDGTLATYDKKHLFGYAGEDKIYTAGTTHLTMEVKGWRIRPFICYDLRFPIWTRNLNLAYDLAIFVANWPARRSAHWRTLLKARAIENQAYVIGVNRVGKDGAGLDHDGHSAVISPMGEVLFEEAQKETIHTVVLYRDPLDDYRSQFPAWRDADREMLTIGEKSITQS